MYHKEHINIYELEYDQHMNSIEAMEFLLSKMKGTTNNDEFLVSMNG